MSLQRQPRITEITSKSNEHFKRWSELDSARGLRKHGEFFLMGEKLIVEFLENPNLKIKAEIFPEGGSPITSSFPEAAIQKISLFSLPKGLFNELDFLGTHFNLLVLELPEIKSFELTTPAQGLEVVCPLGDPSNLGALIRSSLAFGAKKMILTEEAASPFLPKSVKASAGAVLKMPFLRAGSLSSVMETLQDVYALDMFGEDIEHFAWPNHLRMLIGEEGPGLQKLKIRHRLKIPTQGVESLNASVAAGIALYCYSRR